MASLFATLTACASSPGPGLSGHRDPQASDPVVTTEVKTRTVCPAELDETPPARPAPAPDARITMNDAGRTYIAGLVGWGQALLAQLTDAGNACHAAQAAETAAARP